MRRLRGGLYCAELPVGGSGSETPPIARWRIEANADGPEPASHVRRKNTCNSRGRGLAARQLIYTNTGAGFQRTRGTETPAARIYQQGMAKLGERFGRIETGYPQRDLRANSCSLAPLYRVCMVTD